MNNATANLSAPMRPLTKWEESMRDKRCDLWVPICGGVYRLSLGYTYLVELERLMGAGLGRLWATIPHAPASPADHPTAPVSHAAHMIRLGLIGGAVGISEGRPFAVSVGDAAAVVDKLAAQPLTLLWQIARGFLNALIHGRDATPEEVAAFTIPAGPPIVPAWALEYRA